MIKEIIEFDIHIEYNIEETRIRGSLGANISHMVS